MASFDFLPPPGMAGDNPTFDDQGRVFDMEGVRWRSGRLEAMPLAQAQTATGGGHEVRAIFGWSNAGVFTTAYGTDRDLYTATGTGATTSRRPAVLSGIKRWNFAAWGNYLLAQPEEKFGVANFQLMIWTGGATAAYVATAPAGATVMLTTPQRQVVNLGTFEEVSGNFNGLCIRWSDLEDYTDWTTSPDNNAGEQILDGASPIAAGQVLGQGIAVLTGDALWYGTFIGQPGQTFRWDRISTTIGPSHKNLACVLDGTLYWLGKDLVMRSWVIGQPVSAVPCPISRTFTTRYNTAKSDYAFLCPYYAQGEVRFYFNDNSLGGTRPTGNSSMIAYCPAESLRAQQPVWIASGTSQTSGYNRTAMFDAADNGLISGDEIGFVYIEERATNGYGLWYFETGDIYAEDGARAIQINEFIPDFEVMSDSIRLTIYARARPQSTEVTKGPYTITTAQTRSHFRVTGMIFRLKFQYLNTNTNFRMGKSLFRYVKLGAR